jgi:hypothetical protein
MHLRLASMATVVATVFTASSAPAVSDHLQCFKVKADTAKAAYTATLTPTDSSFPVSAGCEIKVPAKLLCVDATKSAVMPAPPGSDDGIPAQQYLCYKTKCPKTDMASSGIDQFGTHALSIKSTSLACAPLALPIHCYDGVVSGDETDVDCGGACPGCAILKDCAVNSDCVIANCAAGACSIPSCSDSMQNGNETDVDCGGSCAGCASSLDCAESDDCASGSCDDGSCAACNMNGDCEPEAYCSAGACLPLIGAACVSGATCPSGFCVDGFCCDTACNSTCEACSVAKKQDGVNGVCGYVASATDPDSDCPGSDVCLSNVCAAPAFIGTSSVPVTLQDSCGDIQGRRCESLVGNVAADALKVRLGTDFALLNSGGLRADFTCPAGGSDNCVASSPPPHGITQAQVIDVLPFGSRVATTSVTGDVLKVLLENGVSIAPASSGRFLQVSGLCYTYDVALPVGSRVTGAVRQALNGSCTGAAVEFTTTQSYSIAMNDFMAGGGDGYPNLLYTSTVGATDWSETIQYIVGASLTPALQGRIVCADSNGATAPNCAP